MSTPRSTHDIVVVGAGHNGLLAATYLAKAGFDVVVLERNERVGGAIASAEVTEPGFVHDLYATNMNLFLGSAAFAELGEELSGHGLSFATTTAPYASAFPDGKSLRAYQDRGRTRQAIAAHDAADAAGWDRLAALYDRFAPTLFELYGTQLPSRAAARGLAGSLRAHGLRGLGDLGRLLLGSTRELGDTYLHSDEAKALLSAWGMHLDFGPDVAFGALFPFLESFADLDNGMSVVTGGAGRLADALAGVARDAGAEIRTSSPVTAILEDGGAAVGVELADGERLTTRRAVIANLTPTPLSTLLPSSGAGATTRAALSGFAYGPGTMMLHLALSGPVPWAAGADLAEFGYVHIGPYVTEMAQTYTDSVNGLLPADPLLVVGQTSAIDPTRAPAGRTVLWVQVRMLPAAIRGDAAGTIEARDWTAARSPYVERVLAKLESYAPGVRDRILSWHAISPLDLETSNPNLVGGDGVGGSHRLSQNGLFRPAPGSSAYRLPLRGLSMVGAGTWPGAGVNGVSGRLAARQLIKGPHRLARLPTTLARLARRDRRGAARRG